MDQTKQPSGKFLGWSSRYKKPNDNRPVFSGVIAEPEGDKEFRMALWGQTDRNGNIMFSGNSNDVEVNASANDQIRAMIAGGKDIGTELESGNLTLRPGQIMIFANKFRDEEHPNRPNYYGRWNTGTRILNISAWEALTPEKQVYLRGATQVPMPGKSLDSAGLEGKSDTELGLMEQEAQENQGKARRSRAAR